MKFHYAGKYSGNPDDLPYIEHEPGAVAFKEAKDANELNKIITTLSLTIFAVGHVICWIRAMDLFIDIIGLFLFLLTIVPHEFLHALCFRDDVYMYQDLKQGMLFVVGPERMSKARAIFKSLLPSIVFGLIPLIIFMIKPDLRPLATMGCLGLAAAAGDFYNVYNTLTQVPKGGKVYMHKYNTYWYMPKN